VVASVLGTVAIYEFTVPGSVEAEVAHAVRFARKLAAAYDGAVHDPQLDETWSRSRGRQIVKPKRDERIKVIDLEFYCRRSELGPHAARLYLDLARRYLPEALPKRFGDHEPLQEKFADAGDDGYVEMWRTSMSSLYFTCAHPCVGGSMSGGPRDQFPMPVWKLNLGIHYEPLRDPRWREAVRRLFVRLADELPAFFATAEVTGGLIWTGRSMWSDMQSDERISPARWREGWLGLPPYPTWWAWYGPGYSPLVSDCLAPGSATSTAKGLLIQASEEPADRHELKDEPRARRPECAVAAYAPNPDRHLPAPLRRAELIPTVLQ
jgi:hypothetical protein